MKADAVGDTTLSATHQPRLSLIVSAFLKLSVLVYNTCLATVAQVIGALAEVYRETAKPHSNAFACVLYTWRWFGPKGSLPPTAAVEDRGPHGICIVPRPWDLEPTSPFQEEKEDVHSNYREYALRHPSPGELLIHPWPERNLCVEVNALYDGRCNAMWL